MQSTFDKVLAACRGMVHTKVKQQRDGNYRMNDPRSPGSDSNSFILKPGKTGEHGTWYIHTTGEGGSLYDLAKDPRLNIDLPDQRTAGIISKVGLDRVPGDEPPTPTPPAKPKPPVAAKPDNKAAPLKSYTHEEYALRLGVTVEYLTGTYLWEVVEEGFKIPHGDGIYRLRRLNGQKPKWQPLAKTDGKRCLYGLDVAIEFAVEMERPLILCNGQSSVVAAHAKYLSAICQTDGENGGLQKHVLQEITDALDKYNLKIVVAYDSDKAGRAMAELVLEQLANYNPGHVDFGANDHYDLGEFAADNPGRYTWTKLQRLIEWKHVGGDGAVAHLQSSKEVTNALQGHVDPSRGETILFPWKGLQDLGGFAKRLQPKFLAAIAAKSGDGKTSLIETFADEWLRDGYDVLMYGPEWDHKTCQMKRVQRNDGATVDQIIDHELWYKDKALGKSEEDRQGAKIPDALVAKSLDLNIKIGNWPGQMHYFPVCDDIDELLENMLDKLRYLRRMGNKPAICIFDHAQILATKDVSNAKNQYEIIISKTKTWLIRHEIAGLMGVQVTKEDANHAHEKGHSLGMNCMHWVRPFEFNLILTINNDKDMAAGDSPVPNQNGDTSHIFVAKNSTGQTGTVLHQFIGRRLYFKEFRGGR